MNTLKALATLITKPKRLKTILSFGHKGYLNSIGWFNAFDQQQALDQNNQPLPWVTYAFIDFIKSRINKTHHVFEYGSGSSTLFYAQRAASVTSVEHDKNWFEDIQKNNPENAEMIFCPLETNGEYSKKASLLNKKFDIIIVDGRDRVNCCKNSITALSEQGVLILDDSEREFYRPAITFLTQNGFKELNFSGISPGLFYLKTTSIFYKPNNCLAI